MQIFKNRRDLCIVRQAIYPSSPHFADTGRLVHRRDSVNRIQHRQSPHLHKLQVLLRTLLHQLDMWRQAVKQEWNPLQSKQLCLHIWVIHRCFYFDSHKKALLRMSITWRSTSWRKESTVDRYWEACERWAFSRVALEEAETSTRWNSWICCILRKSTQTNGTSR